MKLLIPLSFAAISAAQLNINPAAFPLLRGRAFPSPSTPESESPQCASAAIDISDSIPTAPPAIMSDLVAHPQSDPCHVTLPASLSSEYSSYTREVDSWLSENKSRLLSLASSCDFASTYTAIITACASVSATGTAVRISAPTTAPTGTLEAGAASRSHNAAAVPRETGMAAVALAAAGIALFAL